MNPIISMEKARAYYTEAYSLEASGKLGKRYLKTQTVTKQLLSELIRLNWEDGTLVACHRISILLKFAPKDPQVLQFIPLALISMTQFLEKNPGVSYIGTALETLREFAKIDDRGRDLYTRVLAAGNALVKQAPKNLLTSVEEQLSELAVLTMTAGKVKEAQALSLTLWKIQI